MTTNLISPNLISKIRLFVLTMAAVVIASAQTPVVSNIAFEGGSHSAVGVDFTVNQTINKARLRYIPVSQGTCEDGQSGRVENNTLSGDGLNHKPFARLNASGLLPNMQYEFCVEASSDNGASWGMGHATFTTLPLPAVHPALPIPPATFNSDYPDTTGYMQVTVDSTCSNFMTLLYAAIDRQQTTGTIIYIPAGQVCSGSYRINHTWPDLIH